MAHDTLELALRRLGYVIEDGDRGQRARAHRGDAVIGRRIVDAMATKLNATIKFDSGPSGTRVTLALPVSREAKVQKQSAA